MFRNIFSPNRWHVRTKDNIARVRKDEAAAREEERKKQDKLKLAVGFDLSLVIFFRWNFLHLKESEARVNFLRKCSGLPEKHNQEENANEKTLTADACSSRNVDLFSDYKNHIKTTNKELEKEKKEEQEKYEKKIGYLTYLGQDTNEALRLKSWYEVAPKRLEVGSEKEINEKDIKTKHNHDPLTFIKSILPAEPKATVKSASKRKRSPSPQPVAQKEHVPKLGKNSKKDGRKHKTKKHKKRSKEHKKEKEKDDQTLKLLKIQQLRKERLRRETTERARQEALLAPKESKNIDVNDTTTKIIQKYNSQFNPELAKQNLN